MIESKHDDAPVPIGGVSFLIRILFCQNYTWQGTIQWLDEQKSIPFRSQLELTLLLNDAVNKSTQASLVSHQWVSTSPVKAGDKIDKTTKTPCGAQTQKSQNQCHENSVR